MTSVAQHAIWLNNEASRLVESGRLLDASCILRSVTDVLWMSAYYKQRGEVPPEPFPSLHFNVAVGAATTHQYANKDLYNPEGKTYIHDHILCPPANLTQESAGYMFRVISIFTMYNAALVHHLLARTTGCETSFVRAMAYYERILRFSKNWPVKAVLRCLVLNNLADVHCELCQYDQSKLCLDMLADIAQRTRCLENCTFISKKEMQGINLNYALAQIPTTAPTA